MDEEHMIEEGIRDYLTFSTTIFHRLLGWPLVKSESYSLETLGNVNSLEKKILVLHEIPAWYIHYYIQKSLWQNINVRSQKEKLDMEMPAAMPSSCRKT